MHKHISFFSTTLMALALLQPSGAGATTAYIYATDGSGNSTGWVEDATIFANNTANSNGAGPGMFVGSNSSTSPRRGLLRFDVVGYNGVNLTSVTSIDAVRLVLTVGMKAGSGGGDGTGGGNCGGGDSTVRTIDIYRVKDVSGTSTGDWGESATTGSSPTIGGTGQGAAAGTGDATWTSRAHSSNPAWATAGGDHETTASDTQSASNTCPYQVTFSGTNLRQDVRAWLGNGATQIPNRGWILINQAEGTAQSFRAFWTKEGEALGYTIGSPAITHYGPVLEIDYTP